MPTIITTGAATAKAYGFGLGNGYFALQLYSGYNNNPYGSIQITSNKKTIISGKLNTGSPATFVAQTNGAITDAINYTASPDFLNPSEASNSVQGVTDYIYRGVQQDLTGYPLVIFKIDSSGNVASAKRFTLNAFFAAYNAIEPAIAYDSTNAYINIFYNAWASSYTNNGFVILQVDIDLNLISVVSVTVPALAPYYLRYIIVRTFSASKVYAELGLVYSYSITAYSDPYPGYEALNATRFVPKNKSWFIQSTVPASGYYDYTVPRSVETDSSGNIYTAYEYQDSFYQFYLYLNKVDVSGNIVWSKRIDLNTTSGSTTYGTRIAIDASGNCYFAYQNSWTYEYSSPIISASIINIIKINSSGVVQYKRRLRGPTQNYFCSCYYYDAWFGFSALCGFNIDSNDPSNMYISAESYMGPMTIKLPTNGSMAGIQKTFPGTVPDPAGPNAIIYEAGSFATDNTQAVVKVNTSHTYTSTTATSSDVSVTTSNISVTNTVRSL